MDNPLSAAQETGDGLGIREVIEPLDKGDGSTSLFCGMVIPFIAPDSDAVVAGQAVLWPGTDQILSLMAEELHQIHLAGLELLFFSKMDIRHFLHLLSVILFMILL